MPLVRMYLGPKHRVSSPPKATNKCMQEQRGAREARGGTGSRSKEKRHGQQGLRKEGKKGRRELLEKRR
eukprot:scaffold278214_cov15-Tisochrysis_lutea.AAC.1